jgi:hypothetical protein
MITIINRDPIIYEALANPQTAYAGEEITFNVTANDTDGYVVMYEWDFDDGNGFQDRTSEYGNTTYSYIERGQYIAQVRITDDDGNTSIAEVNIEIVNTPPEITITYPTEDEEVGDTVIITGNAWDMDSDITKVEVRIGDGNWYLATDESGNGSWYIWERSWDSMDVLNGVHKIYARAHDDENVTDPPANVSVIVDNEPQDIDVTADLNLSSVEVGGTVEVSGYVIYDVGEPVENAEVNITIQYEVGYWVTTTNSTGYYTQEITAPSDTGTYAIRVNAKKEYFDEVFTDVDQENLQVIEITEPDLEVSTNDIDFIPSVPNSGDDVQIRITVHNLGNAPASDVAVNVYSGDSGSYDTYIGSDTITSISEDGGYELATVDWDTSGISGVVYIYALLDPTDSITESDETNNEASKSITVQGKPDFTIAAEDITFSTQNPKQGEEFTIQLKIHNIGSEDGTVNYKVYDGDPDAGGTEIYSNPLPLSIAANDDVTEQVLWTPDEGGDHEIWIRLDPGDTVDEYSETNNEAYKTINVESLPPEEGIPGWLIPLIVVLVVVVFLILFLLSRGRIGPKPEQELPTAKVVQKEAEEKTAEEEKEKEGLLESHGGIRIG